MKRFITFWKDTGSDALRGRTVRLFKVSWDDDSGEWVKDEEGPYWGIYKLDTNEVRRLNRPPEEMGTVSDEEGYPLHMTFEPDPNDVTVVTLEAEDVSITPEGLNLGEEE